jgi:hypothetical protein
VHVQCSRLRIIIVHAREERGGSAESKTKRTTKQGENT